MFLIFPNIYDISGYPEFVKKHGYDFSYQLCPRAKIFRRDQGNINDIHTLMAFMRYNGYKKDPFSEGNPMDSICSRGDLSTTHKEPFGCIDSKVTCYSLQKDIKSYAVSGPTTYNGLPPFSWKPFNSTIHDGEPELFDFPYIFMDPKY